MFKAFQFNMSYHVFYDFMIFFVNICIFYLFKVVESIYLSICLSIYLGGGERSEAAGRPLVPLLQGGGHQHGAPPGGLGRPPGPRGSQEGGPAGGPQGPAVLLRGS